VSGKSRREPGREGGKGAKERGFIRRGCIGANGREDVRKSHLVKKVWGRSIEGEIGRRGKGV